MFKKPIPKEVARESKRDISAAVRGLEREIGALQAEEKRLIAETKSAAKAGGSEAGTRALARDVVRVRGQIARLQASKARVRGVGTRVQTAQASLAVADAVGSAGRVMGGVNRQLDPVEAQRMAAAFQMEAARLEMSEEAMGSALEDAVDGDGAEEEADDVAAQVLEELGVEAAAQLASAPRAPIRGTEAEVDSAKDVDDYDLERRLAALRSS